MTERTFDDIKRLGPTYLRIRRLAEPQMSRTVAALGSRTALAHESAPVNIEALNLADRIERQVREWLKEARELGAGVDRDESAPRPMTVQDAARALRVSEERIHALLRTGRLGSIRIHGRRLVWSNDVEDYAEERRVSRATGVGSASARRSRS